MNILKTMQGVCSLGGCHAAGEGLACDPAEGARLCRPAADGGDAEAQHWLALAYAKGDRVTLDGTEALTWHRRAAEEGDTWHPLDLDEVLESGSCDAKDEAAATQWYRRAAHQRNAVAQRSLAAMYREARGVAKISAEVIPLLHRASASGQSDEALALATMDANGESLSKDAGEACFWALRVQWDDEAKAQAEALLGALAKSVTSRQMAKSRQRLDHPDFG